MSWTRVNLPDCDDRFVRALASRCNGGPIGVFRDFVGPVPVSPKTIRDRLFAKNRDRPIGVPAFFVRLQGGATIPCFDPNLLPFPHAKSKKMVYAARVFEWFDRECRSARIYMYMVWKSMDDFHRACDISRDEVVTSWVMEV